MEDVIYNILEDVYGEHKAKEKLDKHLQIRKHSFSLARLITTFGVDIAKEKFIQKIEKDRKKGTLAGYIERYGIELGNSKYLEKNSRLSISESALRKNGKTDEEIYEIKKVHSAKSAHTLDNYIAKYGEVIGTERFNLQESTHRTRSVRCVEFYETRGFSREESIILVSDSQRRDFDFLSEKGWTRDEYIEYCKRKTLQWQKSAYIEKYGSAGELIYHYDRAKGSRLTYFLEKYGDVLGTDKYHEMLRKKAAQARDSNIQKEFSQLLYDKLENQYKQVFCGQPITESFWINHIPNASNIKCSVPDIRIKNILIEFDGEYWHSSEDAQNRDNMKDALNAMQGFLTLRIPEQDFRSDKNGTVSFAVKYINEHIDINFERKTNEN